MPATPFHLGPGVLIKAAAPRQFSMAAYSLAQVVIDVESGYYMLQGEYPVHRQAHTFLLGGMIGLLCGLIVWWLVFRGISISTSVRSGASRAWPSMNL